MILDSVSGKISPSFGYMTTYVELLVRYAELMKIKVAEGFFEKFFLEGSKSPCWEHQGGQGKVHGCEEALKKESRGRTPASDRPQYCAGNRLVGEVVDSICGYGDIIIFFAASHCGNRNNPSGQRDTFLSMQ